MRIDVLTLFPRMCAGPFGESILAKAQGSGLLTLNSVDIRDFAPGKHRVTDDTPYGGGQGMVMKIDPIYGALESVRSPNSKVVLLSPAGRLFSQRVAEEYAKLDHLILVSGHYEGVDQRVADHLVDEELSIGDFVLTNGTIAAVIVVDAVARLIPGVLGDSSSATDDSFSTGRLEHPQYTRPPEFMGWEVPKVLFSGNHSAIAEWRRKESLAKTQLRRPDLLSPSPPCKSNEDTR
jgi:tRNA (guanine37-N1)-methyltransferase